MLVLLAILIFVYNFAAAFYFASGVELPPAVEFLYIAAFPCAVVWWLRSEKRWSAVIPLYCLGVLVFTGWPFIIPYHLLKTRGVKGLLPLFALIASFVVSQILALVLYVVMVQL